MDNELEIIKKCGRQATREKLALKRKLWCFSKDSFDALMEKNGWNDENVPTNAAFISIGEPDTREHWFKHNHDNVLNIDFHDIDLYEFFRIIAHKKDGRNIEVRVTYNSARVVVHKDDGSEVYYDCMNDIQAEEIVRFVIRNAGKDFYIHCHAGLSRSQAVTVFIMKNFTKFYDYNSLNTNNLPQIPNDWVYESLCNVLEENNDRFLQEEIFNKGVKD